MFTQYIRKEMNTFLAKNTKYANVSDTQSELRGSNNKTGDLGYHVMKHQYSMSNQPLHTAQNRNATSPIVNPYSGTESSLTP